MTRKEQQLVDTVWEYYRQHGRHKLPWRQKSHRKPYDILVSEVMLQQTQVARVVPKYRVFMGRWGSARALARAPLGEVLQAWQGLGYNSRAKRLWECATLVTKERQGRWPTTYEGLLTLPGVGPYTAAAVMAFAYNEPVPLVETNVRTVFIHHFFTTTDVVDDAEILKLVTRTLPEQNVREWYAALMDYGSYLKQMHGNNITQSKQYKKQSRFQGSDRQIRGAILRALTTSCTRKTLQQQLSDHEPDRVSQQLVRLEAEGLVVKTRAKYHLPH